jgi:hypothetical protein
MRVRPRSELLTLLRDQLHEPVAAGAYTDARLVPHLQWALDEAWEELTATVEGPGRVHQDITIALAHPDGYVPGFTVPMPARWLRMVVVQRNGVPLEQGRPDRTDIGEPGRYWVDGPGQETVLGVLQAVPGVLLTSEAWVAGDVLRWLYVAQAPRLVDPASPGTDTTVDLMTAAFEAAVVGLAAQRAVAKQDQVTLTRAARAAGEDVARMTRRKGDQHQGPVTLADYRRIAVRR